MGKRSTKTRSSGWSAGCSLPGVEQYGVRVTENQFIIDGLPQDAVKLISFDGLLPGHSRALWSLAAHRLDLRFAKTCLSLINAAENDARKALWRVAITSYCKCFAQTNKKGGRRPLHPNKILPAGQPREIHRWFMSLRNMNVVHDENGLLQTLSGAVIASPGKDYNIEMVTCATVEGESLSQAHFGNLTLSIEHALKWVNAEFEKLCVQISKELENIPRETLLRQPNVTYRAPEADDVHSPRPPT